MWQALPANSTRTDRCDHRTASTYTVDLIHFLFGDMLGVTRSDLWLTAGLGGLVMLAILAFYEKFKAVDTLDKSC